MVLPGHDGWLSADPLPGGARSLTGNGDASVEGGIEWLLQIVGRLGVPGLAALRVPQDRDDEIVAKASTASG